MRIHEIPGNPGCRGKRKRVGRGKGSGHGQTCGRGTKGAKSRAGTPKRTHFEGGQMPLIRRIPKRGFTNIFRKEFMPVNLKIIETHFGSGSEVTPDSLCKAGIIHNSEQRVKILGKGNVSKVLVIKAHAFSKSAIEKIQAGGGRCEVLSS